MAISASRIVSVTPRVLSAGGEDLDFNGLFLINDDSIPGIVKTFSTASAVGAFFGTTSEAYQAASTYFNGYTNSFKKPTAILFARIIDEAKPAFLQGAEYTGKLSAITALTAGDINGITVDLSSATSYSDVASLLTDALDGYTVTYSSLLDAFTVTTDTTGSEAEIDYFTGTIAELLNLTEDSGAVISAGYDAMDTAANMDAIVSETQNWVTFTTIESPSEDLALELADWANDQGVAYLYVCHETDVNVPIATALAEANVGATCDIYGGLQYAAFLMGAAASIDWDRRNGTITFAFKTADGLAAAVTDDETAAALDEANVNYVGNHATRNDNFIFSYAGVMFGDYSYIDTYLNAVWFYSALQTAIVNGFTLAGRVPYNDAGYTLIKSWCQDPINRALYNGVIDTGVALSESQIAELYAEAGRDISTELDTDGYVLAVGYDEEASSTEASVRQTRESPEASIWYTTAGSVHKLDIAATVIK